MGYAIRLKTDGDLAGGQDARDGAGRDGCGEWGDQLGSIGLVSLQGAGVEC